ncbi:MAG TPA: TIGR02281 family clan AA aspartic protease [Chromatiales bacterium]|nr:TIGR02281 family clan AA aspartic protease [Chromatiales bacterium]
MIWLAWIVLLALLTYLFSQYLDRQNNPNRNLATSVKASGAMEVVLQRNRAGHYVASGQINGKSVIFLLDTGATNVAIPLRLASKLGLKKGAESRSMTANGEVISWLTRLDRVELGGIVMKDVRAAILPGMGGKEVLLGMSFLKHLDLIQSGDTLVVRVPSND